MAVRHEGELLREAAQGLLRFLEGLRDAAPIELVEAEVEIPFVGKLAGDTASADLECFWGVSLLAEDIAGSRASDTWKIRISITKGRAAVVIVERYDAPATS